MYMKLLRCKWLGPVVMLFASLLVMNGCGGGGGSSTPSPLTKAAISGTVTFPTLNNLIAKRLAAPAPPTVELRDLNGAVIATTTATGTGPYSYSFPNVTFGDYVVKVVSAGQVLKAMVGKNDLSTTTTTVRDLNAIATATVIVAEQKLGVPAGTIGETANSVSAAGIAGVDPKTIEANITAAVTTIQTAPTTATQTTVNLVNLTNVVIATVSNAVDTSAFIAGTATTTSVSTTQLTYTTAGTAPTTATNVAVTPAIAQAVVTTVAPTVVYLQTRSTETSTFVAGWIAVDTTVYSAATLKDASNNTVPTMTTNGTGITKADYQVYDCFTGTSCVTGVPYQDNGYYSNFSALSAGSYNYVLTPVATSTVVNPVPVNYAAASALPVIASANMSATNSGSDISFSWTNPTTAANWSSVGIVKIMIQDTAATGKRVIINLKPTATSVTLPNSVITAAGLDPASSTMQWLMQTRQYTNGVNVARGQSNWKNIPVYTPPATPPTTSAMQTLMASGFYEIDSQWNGTKDFYYINHIYLPASSATLAEAATYLDPITKSWITTKPTGFPTQNTAYALTSTGWVTILDNASDHTMTFNADGTASLKAAAYGGDAKISLTQTDVSGQQIPANALRGAPLITNPAVFPAGSLRYDLAWTQISDDYKLWDTVGPAGSTLTSLPSSTNFFYVEGNSLTYYYNAQFVGGGSNVVNIYQGLQNSTAQSTLIGTATYTISTVRTQQILEISIPTSLRTAYNLGGNPIFASAPNGYIMEGVHDFPGATSNGTNGGSFNKIAMDHIQANLNTSLMKTVVANSLSKSIFGR